MELKEIFPLTNEQGRKFLSYLQGARLLGIGQTEENKSRKEFYVVYVRGSVPRVAILPTKESPDDGSCFFGTLDYFAVVAACNKIGVRVFWQRYDRPMFPEWAGKEKYAQYKREYDNFITKFV